MIVDKSPRHSISKIKYLTIGKDLPAKERPRRVELPYHDLSLRAKREFGNEPFTQAELYDRVVNPEKLRLTPAEVRWTMKRGIQTGYFKKAPITTVLVLAGLVALPFVLHSLVEEPEGE